MIKISVSDTGVGININDLHKLFKVGNRVGKWEPMENCIQVLVYY
jgi:signal transduction histidine kinase